MVISQMRAWAAFLHQLRAAAPPSRPKVFIVAPMTSEISFATKPWISHLGSIDGRLATQHGVRVSGISRTHSYVYILMAWYIIWTANGLFLLFTVDLEISTMRRACVERLISQNNTCRWAPGKKCKKWLVLRLALSLCATKNKFIHQVLPHVRLNNGAHARHKRAFDSNLKELFTQCDSKKSSTAQKLLFSWTLQGTQPIHTILLYYWV